MACIICQQPADYRCELKGLIISLCELHVDDVSCEHVLQPMKIQAA